MLAVNAEGLMSPGGGAVSVMMRQQHVCFQLQHERRTVTQ